MLCFNRLIRIVHRAIRIFIFYAQNRIIVGEHSVQRDMF